MYLVSKKAYMNRLKNILQSDASNYIHIGILILLYYISRNSYWGYILLVPEVIFVFKKSKNILIYAFIILLILLIRFEQIDGKPKSLDYPVQGIVQEINTDYFIMKTDHKIQCYYEYVDQLTPGIEVIVYGYDIEIKTYNIPHVFDYETYLKSIGITKTISVQRLEIEDIHFNINSLNYKLIESIDSRFEQKTASYMKLFVLGENDGNNIDSDSASNLGISHIFAVSGMHIGLISGFLLSLLKKTNMAIETNQLVIIVFLIIYNIATGFQYSILRASMLMTGLFLKDILHIILTKTDLITFSFILLLLINPYSFYSIGFQLSFLISISIIMGQYIFTGENLTKLIKVTILATFIGLPIILEINQTFGMIFIVSNVFFVLFLTYLILPMSFLVFCISMFSKLYEIILSIFEMSVDFFEKINIMLHFNFSTDLYKLLYWMIIIMILKNYNNIRRMVVLFISLIMLVMISLTHNQISNRFIRFLDVNQGDSIHIHDQGCDMLIDTGKSDTHNQLIEYLKASNIFQIDIVLITHLHDDHYGELDDILSEFNVNKIYVNQSLTNLDNEEVIKKGYCFSCGTSKFQVIYSYNNDNNENNNSLVVYGEIANTRFLFTGDIEALSEEIIVNSYDFEVEVLKVPHHGSTTSSTQSFLENLNATIAVVSVGKNNQYDLPSNEVIKRLSSNGMIVFRTDLDGTISFYDLPLTDTMIIERYIHKKLRKYIIWNI